MKWQFSPEIQLLLEKNTKNDVTMHYMQHKWQMPKLSPRPPFYKKPTYEFTFPKL